MHEFDVGQSDAIWVPDTTDYRGPKLDVVYKLAAETCSHYTMLFLQYLLSLSCLFGPGSILGS